MFISNFSFIPYSRVFFVLSTPGLKKSYIKKILKKSRILNVAQIWKKFAKENISKFSTNFLWARHFLCTTFSAFKETFLMDLFLQNQTIDTSKFLENHEQISPWTFMHSILCVQRSCQVVFCAFFVRRYDYFWYRFI